MAAKKKIVKKAKTTKNRGRPSKYSEDLIVKILSRLTTGEGLVKICKSKSMPDLGTIYNWLQKHEDFFKRYARARDEQADTLADEITYIADTEPDVNKARVRVDARKWVAAKLKPKKYGDRQTIEHEAGDNIMGLVASMINEKAKNG